MKDRLLDRYELLQEIGRGGMGTVHCALDHHTGERVAVKHLRGEIADPNILERFAREGDILRRLNHPNIVQLREVIQSEDQHYLVMEYVPGGSLRQMLDRSQRLQVRQTLSLSIEIADALSRSHHLGVIHRDIKPANVLLAEDGTPRLADFGIARTSDADLTAAGMIVGTLAYLSPEVLQGMEADSRSDIWSFGIMLFEMVTGERPFQAENDLAASVRSILDDPLPDLENLRPELPPALVDLIYRMLAREPAERIPSFRLVAAELESIQQGRDGDRHLLRESRAPRSDRPITDSTPDNLPAQTTAFVGRDAEVAEVKRTLDEARLVTILAQGGMGKTRLSLEVARQIRSRFAHGVVFVPLAQIDSARQLPQTIAEALRLSLSSQDDPRTQVIDSLRTKTMLLVLDNFEHLLEGRGLVQELLESAPGLRILATSRERLSLGSEVLCNLTSMKTADWKSVDEALTYSAVQLFVQGARRARASFALKKADTAALSRICRLVEGLPLAILLAAAWVDTLSVDEIADEIGKSTAFLETELHDVPERQRSVRAVFDSTWQRLAPADQELFSRLSVFRASFGREAAQAVAGASLHGLARLLSKSLLTRDFDSGRYHIHELLRQFAEEQLELSPGGNRKVLEAHAAFFASLMQERWSHLKDHRAAAALSEIKDDIENIRAAWRTSLERRDVTQLRRFFESFWMTHEVWGWFRPAIDLFSEAGSSLDSGALPDDGWKTVHAYSLAVEGWFTSLVGRPEIGIGMARTSLDILTRSGDELYLPISSVNINAIFLNLLNEAEPASRALVDHAQRRADTWQEGFGLVWLAYVEMAKGKLAEAQALGEASFACFERLKNPFGISVSAGIVLGAIHMARAQFDNARKAYESGLEAARSIDYRRVIQLAYDSLGTIAFLENRIDDAYSCFLKSLKITYENGQAREQLGSLRDIANIYKVRGSIAEAVELLAVVLHHPAREQNSLSRLESLKTESERLLEEIETMLSAERRKMAWERGASLELGAVVDGLLRKDANQAADEDTVLLETQTP